MFFVILGIINGEYLRPAYRNVIILKNILGSLPNFIGSYILFVIMFGFLNNKIFHEKDIKEIRLLLYFFGVLIFAFLTIEEYYPFFTGSKTFDVFDIIANGIGVLFAFLSFEFLFNCCLKKKCLSNIV